MVPELEAEIDDNAIATFQHLGKNELGQNDWSHHVGLQVAVDELNRGIKQ